jgi:phage pi2 protein 07
VIFAITVSNRGSASDAFEISSDGIPGEWKYKKKVLVQKHSSETVYYEIMAKEAGNYKVKFDVKSLSSDLIQKEVTADLVAEPGLKSELQASSHGLVLFPNPMQAVYSLVGFLANLVK